ncbi:hypothetical protein BJ742DRAFT_238759 [Cladochytrium replicatum]|nr:hypothetical protein BJ742DRAFT_238759 [Cladochytrium replicatum]
MPRNCPSSNLIVVALLLLTIATIVTAFPTAPDLRPRPDFVERRNLISPKSLISKRDYSDNSGDDDGVAVDHGADDEGEGDGQPRDDTFTGDSDLLLDDASEDGNEYDLEEGNSDREELDNTFGIAAYEGSDYDTVDKSSLSKDPLNILAIYGPEAIVSVSPTAEHAAPYLDEIMMPTQLPLAEGSSSSIPANGTEPTTTTSAPANATETASNSGTVTMVNGTVTGAKQTTLVAAPTDIDLNTLRSISLLSGSAAITTTTTSTNSIENNSGSTSTATTTTTTTNGSNAGSSSTTTTATTTASTNTSTPDPNELDCIQVIEDPNLECKDVPSIDESKFDCSIDVDFGNDFVCTDINGSEFDCEPIEGQVPGGSSNGGGSGGGEPGSAATTSTVGEGSAALTAEATASVAGQGQSAGLNSGGFVWKPDAAEWIRSGFLTAFIMALSAVVLL